MGRRPPRFPRHRPNFAEAVPSPLQTRHIDSNRSPEQALGAPGASDRERLLRTSIGGSPGSSSKPGGRVAPKPAPKLAPLARLGRPAGANFRVVGSNCAQIRGLSASLGPHLGAALPPTCVAPHRLPKDLLGAPSRDDAKSIPRARRKMLDRRDGAIGAVIKLRTQAASRPIVGGRRDGRPLRRLARSLELRLPLEHRRWVGPRRPSRAILRWTTSAAPCERALHRAQGSARGADFFAWCRQEGRPAVHVQCERRAHTP